MAEQKIEIFDNRVFPPLIRVNRGDRVLITNQGPGDIAVSFSLDDIRPIKEKETLELEVDPALVVGVYRLWVLSRTSRPSPLSGEIDVVS